MTYLQTYHLCTGIFQEYTYCIRRVILTYSRAKLLVKKAKGFELMLIDSSREGCSLRQKLKFYRCLLENGLFPPAEPVS